MTRKHFDDTDLIDRVKNSSFLGRFIDDYFAQNFYAAFCNNEYAVDDNDVVASYSWRSSGGIVAEIRNLVTGFHEDYMDWYCSGISIFQATGFVEEGVLTEEIEECLNQIGLDYIGFIEC
jgi:hypothetical protein